jgi:SAM-dependent methyltransferase
MRRSRIPRLALYAFLSLDQLFLPNVHREKSVFSLLEGEPGKLTILDAGCGLGYMSYKLIRRGHEVYSGDVNDGFRRTLTCLPQQYRRKVNLIRFDLRYLPFRQNCFDVAICVDVLEHVENAGDAISELHDVLRLGGKAIVHIPSIEGLGHAWTQNLVQLGDSTERFRGHARHGYTIRELERALKEAKFSDMVFFHTFNRTIQEMAKLERNIAIRIATHLVFRQIARFESPLKSDSRYRRGEFEGIMVEATRSRG